MEKWAALPDVVQRRLLMYHLICIKNRVRKPNSYILQWLSTSSQHDCRRLDLSLQYLGPRGLLALFTLLPYIPTVEELVLRRQRWYTSGFRYRQTSIDGATVIQAMTQSLVLLPKLTKVVLDGNELTTYGYLWIINMCKASVLPLVVSVEDTLLTDAQRTHIWATCEIRKKKAATVVAGKDGAAMGLTPVGSMTPTSPSFFGSAGGAPKTVHGGLITGAVGPMTVPAGSTTFVPLVGEKGANVNLLIESLLTDDSRIFSMKVRGRPGSPSGAARPAAVAAPMKDIPWSKLSDTKGLTATQRAMPPQPTSTATLQAMTNFAQSAASNKSLAGGLPVMLLPALATRLQAAAATDIAVASKKHPASAVLLPPAKIEADIQKLLQLIAMNPILSMIDDGDRRKFAEQMTFFVLPTNESYLCDAGDPVDHVYLVEEGEVQNQRSEDLITRVGKGALVGDEELLFNVVDYQGGGSLGASTQAPSASIATGGMGGGPLASLPFPQDIRRRISIRPVTEKGCKVWQIRSTVFFEHLSAKVSLHRREWKKFGDLLPSLMALGTAGKQNVMDCFRSMTLAQDEVLSNGEGLLTTVFFVVEGVVRIMYHRTELRSLSRGDIFVCAPNSDVSRASAVSATNGTTVAVVPMAFFKTLPQSVQQHFASQARVYSMMART